jgi:hypothetical protein
VCNIERRVTVALFGSVLAVKLLSLLLCCVQCNNSVLYATVLLLLISLLCVTQVLCHNVAAKVLHYFLPRLRMSQAIMLLIVRATVPIMALLAAIIAAVRNDTGEHCTTTVYNPLLTLLTVAVLMVYK